MEQKAKKQSAARLMTLAYPVLIAISFGAGLATHPPPRGRGLLGCWSQEGNGLLGDSVRAMSGRVLHEFINKTCSSILFLSDGGVSSNCETLLPSTQSSHLRFSLKAISLFSFRLDEFGCSKSHSSVNVKP